MYMHMHSPCPCTCYMCMWCMYMARTCIIRCACGFAGRGPALGVGMRVPAAEILEGRVGVGAAAPCEAAGRADGGGRGYKTTADVPADEAAKRKAGSQSGAEAALMAVGMSPLPLACGGEDKRDSSPWTRRGGARPSGRRRRCLRDRLR